MNEIKEQQVKIVAGNLITFKNPKYSYEFHYYLVLYGLIDQNGINYKVCSLGYAPGCTKAFKLGTSILDREAKLVGKLSGDAFYEIKAGYYKNGCISVWENPNNAVYDAEPMPSVKVNRAL